MVDLTRELTKGYCQEFNTLALAGSTGLLEYLLTAFQPINPYASSGQFIQNKIMLKS